MCVDTIAGTCVADDFVLDGWDEEEVGVGLE